MKKLLTLIFALIAMTSMAFAEPNAEPNYLCFEVKAGTTISLIKCGNVDPNIQYSFDRQSWTNFSELIVENDCCIYFKGENPNGFSTSYSRQYNSGNYYYTGKYSYFEVSKEFKCSGNVMSLIDGVGKEKNIPNKYCFVGLFKNCPLTTAPQLPATKLTEYCYCGMFSGCTSLTTAPDIPATRLAEDCYRDMFSGCTSLTTAPKLPATTLEKNCYVNMFSGCTSLTITPDLPATRLSECCYLQMFSGCSSLTAAPLLPATTLSEGCYNGMFSGCTSLTTAPELPATTVAGGCYSGMFSGCTSLTTAPDLPATTVAGGCYSGMFSGCTSLTTAPDLPATTVAKGCYWGMFSGCTSLTTAPELPATILSESCYEEMFSGCINLTIVPSYLPAIELAERCCARMFKGCSSLTIAPELPATNMFKTSSNTAIIRCYEEMFFDCINLKYLSVNFLQFAHKIYEGRPMNTTDWVKYVSETGTFACFEDIEQKFGDDYIPVGWTVINKYRVDCVRFITADKPTATTYDKVNLTIQDRTSDGLKPNQVIFRYKKDGKLVIDRIDVKDHKVSFEMKDYLSDVRIEAFYTSVIHDIFTDEFSQVADSRAKEDDAISVTFKQREGFDLVSATYNGNPLNINDYKATFTMPAQDVEIKTVYTEKVYEIEKPSEGVSVSQPSAKAGDEITISVNPKDGYTVHLYVNGAEVALSGNSAVYIMPSGKIEITVKYVVEEKTPVSEIELDNCAVSVFPNPAKSGEEITLNVGGKFDMNNAKIYLYNASGSLVMQIDNVKEYNQLTLRSGVYVGVLVTKGGKKTFRVAVK